MSKKNGKRPANSQVLREANGRWKKGTPPPNPAGRPADGESWGAVFKRIFNMTPKEAAKFAGEIGKRLELYGAKQTTLKELITYRLADALLFDPSAGLLNAVMDRAEGKLGQSIELTWREEARQAGYDPDSLVVEFARHAGIKTHAPDAD